MEQRRRLVGLIVNPVAGMGGSVGLKGTDGAMSQRARELGAAPVTPARTQAFLDALHTGTALAFLAAPGAMGASLLADRDFDFEVVGRTGEVTGPADTRRIAGEMLARGVELLVFVGGDGTARDICDAVDARIPVVAVPAGVKVYSAVFAVSPRAAAEMVDGFFHGAAVGEEEVLDIDEAAFRAGSLDAQLYGVLEVPQLERFLQGGKEASDSGLPAQTAKREVGEYVAGQAERETLYLLGPGTTVRAVAEAWGLAKTLLGVDAVLDGELVGVDLAERDLLRLLARHPRAKIVVTPLGGNGFVFGRGNKQFTPEVIRKVGCGNLIIVSIPSKLADLPCLRVDTGDSELDGELAGYVEVVVGFRRSRMMRLEC
jgi:predicted polyphosphate/ATP-dependent NAD kinase